MDLLLDPYFSKMEIEDEDEEDKLSRGGEHLYDKKNLSMASHMLKHVVDQHEGEKFEQVVCLTVS